MQLAPPGTLDRLAQLFAVVRDVLVALVGIAIAIVTPGTADAFGVAGVLSYIWASMFVAGGVLSAVGLLTRRPQARILGCFIAAGAFAVWAIAAVSTSGGDLVLITVALVYGKCAFAQAARAIDVARGVEA